MKVTVSTEDLIQKGIDGELAPGERDRLDRHLADHPEEAARFRKLKRQSELLGQSPPVPARDHLASLVGKAGPGPKRMFRPAASVAILAVGIGIGFSLPRDTGMASADLVRFANDARAAHRLYASEVLHPVEVGASDKNHLQSWLSNRLGATVIAPHLGEMGYSLIGGRLLPADDQASALFMYENEFGERLSLMATHGSSQRNQSVRFRQDGQFMVLFWQDGPWKYSLVGSQKQEPMGAIARLIHSQMI